MIEPTVTDTVLQALHQQALCASDAFKMAQRFVDVGGELPTELMGSVPRSRCVWLRTSLNQLEKMTERPQLERQRYWRAAFGSSIQKRWFTQ